MAMLKLEIGVSTMIAAMRYDADIKTLKVDFPIRNSDKVNKYTYENVPQATVDTMLKEIDLPGGSLGRKFTELVRSKATKIEDNRFTL